MILQVGKKGSDNLVFQESKVIESFTVGGLKEIFIPTKSSKDSDDELALREKNYSAAIEAIGKTGLCRENIIWHLGEPAIEENDVLTVVTTDDETYVFSRIGCPDKVVFILNNSGKTISRVL